MIKLFLLLLFTFSLVSTCENKKNEESSTHHSETEIHDKTIPHDSLLVPVHQTPPIIKQGENIPTQKNDSI